MGYAYRGTTFDTDEPAPARTRKLTGFDPSACGEYRGYRRHQKHGVPACDPCLAAMAAYSRDRYTPRPPKMFNPDACGTWTGWQRHKYHDVPLCDACREVGRVNQREYQRAYRARKKVAA